MRILYVCDALTIYGGLERVLIEKANWLVEHGDCEVCLLTVNQGSHPIPYPLHPNVLYDDLDIRFYQQYQFPFWQRFFMSRQLRHLFRERLANKIQKLMPDLIICARLDYVRDILKVKGAIPVIFESHSSRLACRFEDKGLLRRLHVWYLQLAVRKVQMVVSLTNGDADEWRKLTPHVCVIPNVVHLNKSGSFSNCTTRSVIYVGRFCKQKDIRSLLHIWKLVYERHPDWRLHIYGGYGEEQETIFADIKQINANILVHEPTSDIIERYKENSVLLLTSRYEPFGLILPEAMSCGLPVVAFDCPYGPKDIVDDGVDGFLVSDRDIEKFVDRVCLLIENCSLREKMGQNGVRSSQRYAEKQIMPLWIQLFEQISHH